MMAFLSVEPSPSTTITAASRTPTAQHQKLQHAFVSTDYLIPPKSRLRPRMFTMAGNIGKRVVKGVLGQSKPHPPQGWNSDVSNHPNIVLHIH